MPQQMIWFFLSIAFSFIAWGIVTARYIWPELRLRQRAEALRPLLILHSFRFIGLAFLVPGVVSPDLPPAFAHSAAYGDIIAAILALLSLISLRSAAGIVVVWIFSLWGSADLLNSFYQGPHTGLLAGQLGASLFHSDLGCPAPADHAWACFPNSSAAFKALRNAAIVKSADSCYLQLRVATAPDPQQHIALLVDLESPLHSPALWQTCRTRLSDHANAPRGCSRTPS